MTADDPAMSGRQVTVWFLELARPENFRPGKAPSRLQVARVAPAEPDTAAWLYREVGGPWHWTDRASWGRAEWENRLAGAGVEIWLASGDAGAIGYYELESREDGSVELAYFGLLPQAIGAGHGTALLASALERAWALGADRVTVNTCSLDHPRALDHYQGRGFRLVREETRVRPAP